MGFERSKISLFCGGLSIFLGVLVLFGWHTHQTVLVQILPNYVAMMYNTALGFFLCGAGLLFLNFSRLREANMMAVLVILLGGIVLVEYLLDADLGIDQFFFKHYIFVATSHPGRMAPNTAICFILAGIVLLTIKHPSQTGRATFFKSLAGMLVFTLGFSAVSGYVLKLEPTYGWGAKMTHMALHTAIGFAILGVGIIAFSWANEKEKAANAPHWLPVLAAFGVFTITLNLWKALEISEHNHFESRIRANSEEIQHEIAFNIRNQVLALTRLAGRWQTLGLSAIETQRFDAAQHIEHHPGLHSLAWVDASNVLQWIEPLKGNEIVLGQDIAFEERRRMAVEMAENKRETVVSRTIDLKLISGGKGMLILAPLIREGVFDGFALAVLRIKDLLESFLDKEKKTGLSLAIYDGEDEVYSYGNKADPELAMWEQETIIPIHGTVWRLKTWPDREMLSGEHSIVDKSILIFGLVVALLLAISIRFAQNAGRYAGELALHRDHLGDLVAKQTDELRVANALLANENLERKLLEEALAKNLREQEAILDANPDIIYVADMQARLIKWNSQVETVTGLSPSELFQKECISFFPPEDAELISSAIRRVFMEGWAQVEANLIGKGGVLIPYQFNGVPLRNEAGEIIGFTGTGRDITERKLAEKELKKISEQLLHSEKLSALGKLTGSIAHEFNNPLYGVRNALEIVSENSVLGREEKHLLQLGVKECDRMADLIRKLRNFYKPSPDEKKPIDIHKDVIEEVALLLKKKFQDRKIELVKEYHPEPLRIRAVGDQIKQVFFNLLLNAEESIHDGGGTITIKTSANNSHVEILVQDTGEGILPENLSKIFEPFFTTKGAIKGTGLGLSLSYGIMKTHGGDIEVESQPGEGTQFTLTFPLHT